MSDTKLMIGWTTVGSEAAARELAEALVAGKLAACVQVEGPVQSYYVWQGKVSCDAEWRLAVKFPLARAVELAAWLDAHHPYEVPQWVAVAVAEVLPAYAEWALATCSG